MHEEHTELEHAVSRALSEYDTFAALRDVGLQWGGHALHLLPRSKRVVEWAGAC